ncbi:MAG: arsenate reductase [Thiomicrorhabdus sp.]|nr:arsenate reductase [Thiomicrorhabdus sp.]
MILYGIANCDTVRKARKFLDEKQISYVFHDFKKQGLTQEIIQNWLKYQPLEILVNKRSTSWKQLTEEQKQQLITGQNLSVLSEMPTLIKRPVLENNGSLLVGFKEAEYQNLVPE